MMSSKKFIIKTDPFDPEILSGFLWDLNISGFTEEEESVSVFGDKNQINKNDIETLLSELKENGLINSFDLYEAIIENKNWNEEWEKSWEVIRISDRIIIKPAFKNYEAKNNEIVLVIDPKMSFGTGEHQTTKICLQLVEKFVEAGMNVLDIGSGTAILAIASVKLGAEKAIAIDNDQLCFENGIENVKQNSVDDSVQVRQGEIQSIIEKDFDLIIANIHKNVLIEISGEIMKRLKIGGKVILSGLLEADYKDINVVYSEIGFNQIDFIQLDEWIGVVYKN